MTSRSPSASAPVAAVPARGRAPRLRLGAFVALSATILVLASERVYWYWAGPGPVALAEITAFYVLPTAATLWTMARVPVRSSHQLVLAAAVYTLVVEGVLTPVIYEDGPLPVVVSMLMGWHGLIAVVGFWYLVRRWLLDRRSGRLAAVAVGFGGLWGLWALVSARHGAPTADELGSMEATYGVLDPDAFAVHAAMVGLVLVAAHLVIGHVWPVGWRPGRRSTRALVLVSLAYATVAAFVLVPWAPLKLAALALPTFWLLRRGRPADPDAPTLLDRLQGQVRARDGAVLLVAPAVAVAAYAASWEIGDGASLEIYETMVAAQLFAGAIAVVWAGRRSLRVGRGR